MSGGVLITLTRCPRREEEIMHPVIQSILPGAVWSWPTNRDGNGGTVPVECERISPLLSPTKLRPLFHRLKRTILREDWVGPRDSPSKFVEIRGGGWYGGKRREKINFSSLTFSKFKFGSRRIEIDLQIVEWRKKCNRYFRYQETISTTSGWQKQLS